MWFVMTQADLSPRANGLVAPSLPRLGHDKPHGWVPDALAPSSNHPGIGKMAPKIHPKVQIWVDFEVKFTKILVNSTKILVNFTLKSTKICTLGWIFGAILPIPG